MTVDDEQPQWLRENDGLEFLRWWLTLSRDERKKVPGVYGDLGDFAPNLDAWKDDDSAAQAATTEAS